jgi:hypothetical protein
MQFCGVETEAECRIIKVTMTDQHKDNHSMTVHFILQMHRIPLLVSWWTFQVEQLLYVAGNVPFQGISVLTLRLSLSLRSSVVH